MSLTELDNRNADGISVSLLWNADTGETFIEIEDMREESVETFPVSAENASDAFQHPFAYLSATRCNNPASNYSVRV